MNYKLKINDVQNLEELNTEIRNGARFIVFSYCISLVFAITLKRFSPATFVRKEDSISNLKNKYNLISYVLGWWCIPSGPMKTLGAIKINNEGGIDITEDILLNITEENLKTKEIDLKFTNLLFDKPTQSEIKALKKALFNKFEDHYKIDKAVVGQFINENYNRGTHYVIGLAINGEFDKYSEPLQKALATQFYKHVHFDIIDLKKESEEMKTLLKQGETLK